MPRILCNTDVIIIERDGASPFAGCKELKTKQTK